MTVDPAQISINFSGPQGGFSPAEKQTASAEDAASLFLALLAAIPAGDPSRAEGRPLPHLGNDAKAGADRADAQKQDDENFNLSAFDEPAPNRLEERPSAAIASEQTPPGENSVPRADDDKPSEPDSQRPAGPAFDLVAASNLAALPQTPPPEEIGPAGEMERRAQRSAGNEADSVADSRALVSFAAHSLRSEAGRTRGQNADAAEPNEAAVERRPDLIPELRAFLEARGENSRPLETAGRGGGAEPNKAASERRPDLIRDLQAFLDARGGNAPPRETAGRRGAVEASDGVFVRSRAPSPALAFAAAARDNAREAASGAAPEIFQHVTVSSLETHFPALVSNLIAERAGQAPSGEQRHVNIRVAPAGTGEAGLEIATPARNLTIELDPPSLGSVTVKMKMSGPRVDLDIRVDSLDALRALSGTRDRLIEAIQASGSAVDSFTIQVGSAPGSNDSSQYAGSHHKEAFANSGADKGASFEDEQAARQGAGNESPPEDRQSRRNASQNDPYRFADRRGGLYL